MCVYIITWQFKDKSMFGIVGVYNDSGLAQKDLDLLQEHGDSLKEFKIVDAIVEGE